MLIFPNDYPRERVELARSFLMSCPIVSLFERSSRVYKLVALAPAQHGYPPQATIETPTGLPLVVDLPMLDDARAEPSKAA